MRFNVFGTTWAGGSPEPLSILQRFVAATPVLLERTDPWMAPHYEVEVTAEELMAMAEAQDFDILISGDLLAFDGLRRRFRQR